MSLDDKALIDRIINQQSDALQILYQRYHRLVFSLALNAVNDHQAAEEITLDVFLRVWKKAATYRPEQAQVRTWLTGITRYRAIDWLRQKQLSLERNSIAWAEVPPDQMPASNDLEESVLRQQIIRTAIAQLSSEQKQVLGLAYFRGHTHQQIAELLDLPLGTVKTRIRLGMQKLHRILQEEGIFLTQ